MSRPEAEDYQDKVRFVGHRKSEPGLAQHPRPAHGGQAGRATRKNAIQIQKKLDDRGRY